MLDPIAQRYLQNDYLENNPEWDQQDSPWKAEKVAAILKENNLEPKTICEVGCGAGGVLGALQKHYPNSNYTGYDIAPAAEQFWTEIKAQGIDCFVGDFFTLNEQYYDVILLLDVLEHVADPHQFLLNLKPYAKHIVIHFPLDLSALSVFREKPLIHVRRKVGHIHSFTKGLALEFLTECELDIIDASFTGAAFTAPQRGVKTKLFGFFRRLCHLFNRDASALLLGGETLMVLVKIK